MPNFFILTDGSADNSALADPTPTNTRPTVATGETGTDGVAYCGGCEVVRLMFGGSDADGETINYQVIGWQQVMGPDGEAWMPELLAGGVATLGADVYAATDMGAGTEYIADTITDTVDRKGNVLYSPANDTRAVIDIPLRGSQYVQVEVDRGTAATIDVWAMFASSGACGIGGNTVDVEVENVDLDKLACQVAAMGVVTVDSTANGQTLATLLSAALQTNLAALTLQPHSGVSQIYYALGNASASTSQVPAGGITLPITKAVADTIKLYAATDAAMTVIQEV